MFITPIANFDFNPKRIPNLALWLDASDTTTISATSGSVDTWSDKSGNGRNFTAVLTQRPTTGSATLNGHNVVRFDGSNDFMTGSSGLYGLSTASNTIIAVVKPVVKQIANIIAGADGSTGRWRLLASDASNLYVGGSNSSTGVIAGGTIVAPIASEVAIITSVFQTSNSCVVTGKNGDLGTPAAGSTFTMTSARLGSATSGVQFLNGDIAELLVITGVPTNALLNTICIYLKNKWAGTFTNIINPVTQLVGSGTIVGFGDSVTLGTGASLQSYGWLYRVGAAMRTIITNKGIGGTFLQNTGSVGNNGRDRYVADLTGAAKRDKALICYGYNDMRAYTDGIRTLALFQNDMQEVITGLLGAGYAATDIVLCTLPWSTDALYSSGGAGFTGSNRTVHENYNAATRVLAVNNGLLWADIYNAMLNDGRGAALIDADNIHPNDAGHGVIAQAVLSATTVT